MRQKACVFVDGENLRHSLIDAFSGAGLFKRSDYLPALARWAEFFDWVVSVATAGSHERLRAYWFVIQDLDCFPYGLSQLGGGGAEAQLRRILLRHPPFRQRLHGLSGAQLMSEMQSMLGQLKETQRSIESQFKGWQNIQNGIAIRHRAIEFRRAGAIAFNLFEKKFGQEKAVDVRLACDMIMLRDIYDMAII